MKMTKKLFVVLLAACALFSFVACGGAESVTGGDNTPPTVDYTKGSVSNNVYTNEWANIKFELDSTWKEGPASDYKTYENTTTDCGLIAGIATEGRQFAIVFEKDITKSYDEKEYLDNATKMLSGVTGYTYGDYYKKTVAGKEYLGVDITLNANGVTVYQAMFVKLYDGRFIAFSVTSASSRDEINSVLAKVTTLK